MSRTILHDPNGYDLIVVSFSGGKDSQACVLHLLEMGIDPAKIELWHQHVDGDQAGRLMDWPCTPAYCAAWAAAMGLPLRSQWKDGGFEGEMLRKDRRTKGIYMHDGNGGYKHLPASTRGKESTRMQFPQRSNDLSTRWCSAYLKIDVAARAIAGDSRLDRGRFLYISGERRQESAARAKYAEVEPHRTDGKRRRVDHWRLVIDYTEHQVWEIIQRYGLVPHPAYRLGWGRLSCLACIYGDDSQWATIRYLAREQFDKIAGYEEQFGKTIAHKRAKKSEGGGIIQLPVIQRATEGSIFQATLDAPEWLRKRAMSTDPYNEIVQVSSDAWEMPAGAFAETSGPT